MKRVTRSGQRPVHRTSLHARRLDALWRISTNPSLDGTQLFQAMLTIGAGALRPGQAFAGRIYRVEDGEIVVEAAVNEYLDAAVRETLTLVGGRLPLSETVQREVLLSGTTRSWADLNAEPALAARPGIRRNGWRSIIATPFRAGGSKYTLSFLSHAPTERRFDGDDHSYIEILASLFERHLQQRWQFDRIRYQSEYDPLTGLSNRGRFAALARTACTHNSHCGIAIVDLDGLREVNESRGVVTGDALLVEVGAALGALAKDGEFVGRLVGDSFGICFPGIASRTALDDRVRAVTAIFAQPFGIGDGHGVERMTLRANIGSALSPDQGLTFDALLARADAMLHSSQSAA